ncbi:hypothetical protein HZH66_002735 [Vespula vulgaris]|uniref:Uncharacterized protein n=1 Tax=Vespula vulgaris TaxID=7454 RepID=A0A834NI13_VESVU|nr:hypothetical protein HZH66_002735 [Vespula vulgaris]
MVNVVTNSDKITTTTEKRNVFGSSKISEGITEFWRTHWISGDDVGEESMQHGLSCREQDYLVFAEFDPILFSCYRQLSTEVPARRQLHRVDEYIGNHRLGIFNCKIVLTAVKEDKFLA